MINNCNFVKGRSNSQPQISYQTKSYQYMSEVQKSLEGIKDIENFDEINCSIKKLNQIKQRRVLLDKIFLSKQNFEKQQEQQVFKKYQNVLENTKNRFISLLKKKDDSMLNNRNFFSNKINSETIYMNQFNEIIRKAIQFKINAEKQNTLNSPINSNQSQNQQENQFDKVKLRLMKRKATLVVNQSLEMKTQYLQTNYYANNVVKNAMNRISQSGNNPLGQQQIKLKQFPNLKNELDQSKKQLIQNYNNSYEKQTMPINTRIQKCQINVRYFKEQQQKNWLKNHMKTKFQQIINNSQDEDKIQQNYNLIPQKEPHILNPFMSGSVGSYIRRFSNQKNKETKSNLSQTNSVNIFKYLNK